MASFEADEAAQDADFGTVADLYMDAEADTDERMITDAETDSGSAMAGADDLAGDDDAETDAPVSFPAGSMDAVLAELAEEGDMQPNADSATPTAVVEGPGVAQSRRPLRRPGDLAVTVSAPAPVPQERETPEIAADTLTPGTPLAQLGALESPEAARAEWDRLASRFDDYLADKSRVIQQASSGGRSFYRLRAHGFEDIAAARRFCAVLIAERAECIPVAAK